MRNNFLNLVAKMPQNTGGGCSRTKNRSVTVSLSSDTTTNREMTERRPREDRETFVLRSSLLGTLKYVACLLLALVLGVGQMWADCEKGTLIFSMEVTSAPSNKIQIAAGFCPNCSIYFIMESTYQRIRRSGIPICRTMDEKTYRHGNRGNISSTYGLLAQESVLKQFGYSVNQVDDISPAQRRLILAALIDNGILTKTDIIGYLDYFINIRKGQKNSDGSLRYSIAIGKWQDDRNYIENYKIGSFKAVEIRTIVVNK